MRFAKASQARKRRAQAAVSFGVVGLESSRPLEAGNCFDEPSTRAQHDAEIMVGGGDVRRERDRLLQKIDRFCSAKLMRHDAAEMEARRVAGGDRADLTTKPLGLDQSSGL